MAKTAEPQKSMETEIPEGLPTQEVVDTVFEAKKVQVRLIRAKIAKHVNVIDQHSVGYPYKGGCEYWLEEPTYRVLLRDGGISTEVTVLVPQRSFVFDPATKQLSPVETELLKPSDVDALKAEGKILLMRGYEHPLSPEPLMSETEKELKDLAVSGKIGYNIKAT